MQTDVITYNLTDRGRKYRGKDRHFNIAAVVAAINGPECQERVRKRDMLGYYGHWPRVRFGMLPAEGGLDKGIPSLVEPAIVTTYLKAHDDGTIEHKAEFLTTESGKVAADLFENHVGGFSSAIIDTAQHTEFFGFDYVLEPNYSTNRGWSLDSASGRFLDSVGNEVDEATIQAAAYDEQVRTIKALLDSVTKERAILNSTIEKLRAENDELIDELTAKKHRDEEENALDSVIKANCNEEFMRLQRDALAFQRTGKLPTLMEEEPRTRGVSTAASDPALSRLIHRFS